MDYDMRKFSKYSVHLKRMVGDAIFKLTKLVEKQKMHSLKIKIANMFEGWTTNSRHYICVLLSYC